MVILGGVRAFSSDYLTTPVALRAAGKKKWRAARELLSWFWQWSPDPAE